MVAVALAVFASSGSALPAPGEADVPGIDERLGGRVPLDLALVDEDGRRVALGELIDRPTIISLVYFGCRNICPLLLGGEAEALGKLDLAPGVDYRAITVSFDPADTPSLATEAKANYTRAVGRPVPPDAWRFLTGTGEATRSLADALGFRYTKSEMGFSHTAALMVVDREGKIVRYLYGVTYLPFDLKMALAEAAEGRVGATSRRVLLYCFSYDAARNRYVFNILRVVGAATAAFVVLFFVYLVVSTRKYRKEHPTPHE
jgi:protein SCO1/2